MSETETTIDAATGEAGETGSEARSRFSKALDEAKAGAGALKDEALEKSAELKDKLAEAAADWSGQARDKGLELARQGKAKASEALAALGKTISGSAETIDEKLGVQYGDYARSAARSLHDTADSLDSKDFAEIGEDLRAFVRKSPATAIGIAAVTGFVLARMFRGSSNDA